VLLLVWDDPTSRSVLGFKTVRKSTQFHVWCCFCHCSDQISILISFFWIPLISISIKSLWIPVLVSLIMVILRCKVFHV
jgi:hypothetical protein